MTRAEKLEMLENLFSIYTKVHKQLNVLQTTLNPDPGCRLYTTIFKLMDIAIDTTALVLEEKEGWLRWMVYENDCGHKGLEAGHNGELKSIRTATDLLNLIENDNGHS